MIDPIQVGVLSVLVFIAIGLVIIRNILVKILKTGNKLVDNTNKLIAIPEQQGTLLKRWWDWLHCLEKRYGTRVEQDDSDT